jgi:hypothetical protein
VHQGQFSGGYQTVDHDLGSPPRPGQGQAQQDGRIRPPRAGLVLVEQADEAAMVTDGRVPGSLVAHPLR